MVARDLHGAVLRRNRKVLVVALGVVGAGLLSVAVAAAAAVELLGFGVMLAMAGAVLLLVWRAGHWPTRQHGAVRATEDGLWLGEEQLAARDALSSGRLRKVPGQMPRAQIIDRRNRVTLEIELSTEAKVRSLLSRARLDPAHTVSEFALTWHWLQNGVTAVPLIFLAFGAIGGVIVALTTLSERWGASSPLVPGLGLALVVLVGALVYRTSRLRLRAGPDGVHIRQFGRERFFRHEEILAVERWPLKRGPRGGAASLGFDIVLRAGGRIRAHTLNPRAMQGDYVGDFIAEAVNAAREAGSGSAAVASPLALQRGARTVDEWIRALEAVGAGKDGGYREALPPPEALWQVLESHAAGPEQRAAAAVVLCANGAPERRRRVRRAADAVARPALREALLAAASGERSALLRALGGLTR